MPDGHFPTIKALVFDFIHRRQGTVDYEALLSAVLAQFPDSAFKRSHWAWYRYQCTKGRFAREFSELEKRNLSASVPQCGGVIPTRQQEHGSETVQLATTPITPQILSSVRKAVRAALAYEHLTTGNRKLGITGEVGEVLACYHLDMRLSIDPRCEGYDAVDANGKRVKIKTRRGESGGMPRDAGRVGTFSKHSFDYALLVILDSQYRLAEIWRAEYADVVPLIEKQRRRNPGLAQFKRRAKRIWRGSAVTK